jgi:UDP-N-acetylglucosamine--N-acetylmuramyl-(pentapeptide) pyrophosphoryl-undecaprenol N-acetylglucosamine transferase
VESRYRQVEFLAEGMGHALAAAVLVISRAGLSTLTEIAALGKPSILIPMPHSHQEANARAFSRPGAAVLLEEDGIAGATLAGIVLDLLANPDGMQTLADHARALMPIGAERGIADILQQVARGRSTSSL